MLGAPCTPGASDDDGDCPVTAAPLKLISSMATRELLAELLPEFTRAGGLPVQAEAGGGVEVAKRVRSGEAVDVVVLAANVIDQLISEGHLLAGSRVDLVRSGIAVAVPAGASQPRLDDEAAVRAAVLAAKTLSYSTGPSGVYLMQLFERWGIADTIRARIVQAPPGVPVGSLVARGEVELGFQQLSELIHLQGITVVGSLPDAIQSITVFSAGVSAGSGRPEAARALVASLAAPDTAVAKQRQGMAPA